MSEKASNNLNLGDSDTKVRLVAQGSNLWRVRMLFPKHRANEIPEQLRQIKAQLAHSFGVADHRLEYVGLHSKKNVQSGILVEMQIRRQEIPAGAVRIRFLPLTASDGTVFSDMQVVIDLFPLDDFERPITLAGVEERIKSEGIETGLIDWPKLRGLIQECLDTQLPLQDQIIGQGHLPDVGMPARLYYRWKPHDDPASVTAWLGLRGVVAGEEIIELNVPVSGLRAGKNVFGKELSPRRGAPCRLSAGHGITLSTTEKRLVSRETGVLVFQRKYHDRRQKDSPRETPTVLEAEVQKFRNVLAEKAENERWEESIWVDGSLSENVRLTVSGDCVITGDVGSGCQIQVSGSLRIMGHVGEATIAVGQHMVVQGKMRGSMCEVGLTAQVIGEAVDCTIFAREIVAEKIVGGVAEAYAAVSTNNDFIHFNKEKLLAEQKAAGEDAMLTLRRQMTRLTEIFGAEILQTVTPDTVQIHLLRWLRQQKTLGVASYTHPQVQELRTLLELAPFLRSQMASIAGELRPNSVQAK